MKVLVLNGPNLNLLGTREPEIYGSTTLADLEAKIQAWGSALGIEVEVGQSNHEGDLVEAIQQARAHDGLIVNAAALTHTSRAIGDAIQSVGLPAVEVHISNIREREPWRAVSLISEFCVRTIYGRGIGGYQDALRHLANRAAMPFETLRFGPHRDNVGDLRVPTGETVGVVTVVHGGLWRQEYERDITETLAVDLAGRGYVTWNIEYRRLGDGGGWPSSAHDVLTAFDFIVGLGRWTGLPAVVIGHSAGGHLGLWAAARRAEALDLVVGLAPITDLAAMSTSSVGSGAAKRLLDSGAPHRLDVVPGKTLLVHGERDEIVPVSHSTRLSTGATVEVIPGMGHFPVLDPNREHWPLVLAELGKAAT